MRRFSAVIDIAATPADVWAVMREVDRWPEWTTSIERVERLDRGPLGVGSRVRVKQPKLAPALFEIISWTPDQGFDWVAKTPGVTALAQHLIEPGDGGARVTLSVEFSGMLARLVGWWFGRLTRRYIQMEADGLKSRVEQRDDEHHFDDPATRRPRV